MGFKSVRNRGESGKSRKLGKPSEGAAGMPEHMKKADCLYIDGEVRKGAHGMWHVSLDNSMNALCTARKMDNLKIGLLEGDQVLCEIPLLSMNPSETLRGRIVWRHRTNNKK